MNIYRQPNSRSWHTTTVQFNNLLGCNDMLLGVKKLNGWENCESVMSFKYRFYMNIQHYLVKNKTIFVANLMLQLTKFIMACNNCRVNITWKLIGSNEMNNVFTAVEFPQDFLFLNLMEVVSVNHVSPFTISHTEFYVSKTFKFL